MSDLKLAPEFKKSWMEDLEIRFSGTVTPPQELKSSDQEVEREDNE